jgi:hypothetical protein
MPSSVTNRVEQGHEGRKRRSRADRSGQLPAVWQRLRRSCVKRPQHDGFRKKRQSSHQRMLHGGHLLPQGAGRMLPDGRAALVALCM